MKKVFMIIFMFIFPLFLLASCNQRKNIIGSGDEIASTYSPVGDFDTIRISDIKMVKGTYIVPIQVFIEGGSEKDIKIIGQEQVIDSISVTTSFGLLYISGNANANYLTESLKIYIKGYVLNTLSFELSTVKAKSEALALDASIDLKYASILEMDSFMGKNLTISMSSNSSANVEDITLSSSLSINSKEQSKFNAINVQAEEARINAQDNSTITFTSKEIKNAIFTLNTNAAIYATGFISSIDLVMNNGNFYGKNCVSNSMAINVGAGLSKVETKTLESISVNTAVGDCEVYYFGANPTITKTNITGNLIIKNGEEG